MHCTAGNFEGVHVNFIIICQLCTCSMTCATNSPNLAYFKVYMCSVQHLTIMYYQSLFSLPSISLSLPPSLPLLLTNCFSVRYFPCQYSFMKEDSSFWRQVKIFVFFGNLMCRSLHWWWVKFWLIFLKLLSVLCLFDNLVNVLEYVTNTVKG